MPHHRRKSPMVGAWLHAGRVIVLRSWEIQQQPNSCDGSMIVGKEFGGMLTQPTPGAAGTNAAPPSSERSDDDSWSREGDVFPPTLSQRGPAWLAEADAEDAVSVEV